MRPGIYQHYSGTMYLVQGTSRHSETLEELVVYRKLYGDYSLWVRPKALFEQNIEHEGKSKPRFTFIKSVDLEAPELR